MAKTETVGVKDLKNNLSAWLRRARKGSRVLVTLRDEVIAEIRRPASEPEEVHPLLRHWILEGKVSQPQRGAGSLPPSPLRSKAGTATRLLAEDRRE
jgi:antitoxin (DNA-binding transcriptional repressor) of toxin-antitoxin stability system